MSEQSWFIRCPVCRELAARDIVDSSLCCAVREANEQIEEANEQIEEAK